MVLKFRLVEWKQRQTELILLSVAGLFVEGRKLFYFILRNNIGYWSDQYFGESRIYVNWSFTLFVQ